MAIQNAINAAVAAGVSARGVDLFFPAGVYVTSSALSVVGSNVVFSTVASGTGPYNYAWSKNGAALDGQTNSSLTLNNVTTSDSKVSRSPDF